MSNLNLQLESAFQTSAFQRRLEKVSGKLRRSFSELERTCSQEKEDA